MKRWILPVGIFVAGALLLFGTRYVAVEVSSSNILEWLARFAPEWLRWLVSPELPTAGHHLYSKELNVNVDMVRLCAQVSISFVLLLVGIFVVLSKNFTPTQKHWAYGSLGTVVGFWLKG